MSVKRWGLGYMLNEHLIREIDRLEEIGFEALEKEAKKVRLYIERCSKDPAIYGDMKYRKEYLAEIKNRLKKYE